jgi:hypothetical protein
VPPDVFVWMELAETFRATGFEEVAAATIMRRRRRA